MFTNLDLVEYVKKVHKAGWVYWYGTVGYKCSQSLYNSKAKQYPTHYTASRKAGYMADIAADKMCADCVGMIKSFFWMNGDINGTNKYASNGCPDTSANGMIELCKEQGPIRTIPEIPGLVVWKKGHIGVYIGNGYTIEERGFNYDCQMRKLSDGPWTKWGKLPSSMLQYVDGAEVKTIQYIEQDDHPMLRNGSKGEEVRALQTALVELGYNLGVWGADGDFGDMTEMAVKSFQKDHGLEADGIVGNKTWDALDQEIVNAKNPVENPQYVEISGGNCYVRTLPNATGEPIGVAYHGDKLIYRGKVDEETGWLAVLYKEKEGWVSCKYGKLVK